MFHANATVSWWWHYSFLLWSAVESEVFHGFSTLVVSFIYEDNSSGFLRSWSPPYTLFGWVWSPPPGECHYSEYHGYWLTVGWNHNPQALKEIWCRDSRFLAEIEYIKVDNIGLAFVCCYRRRNNFITLWIFPPGTTISPAASCAHLHSFSLLLHFPVLICTVQLSR